MEMEVDQPEIHVKAEAERLELSEAALTALEVFQSSIGIKARSGEFAYTVFGVVNKCRTSAGKKLLADWLKHPLCDVERLNQRLDVVEAFDGAANCRELLHKSLLPQIPEVEKLADKLGTPKGLPRVNETPAVQQLISIPLQKSAKELEKFGELVEQTIEFVKETGEYRMEALERKAERILSDLKSEVDCDNLKKEKDPEIGYVFRVTLKSEKAIRAQKFTVISTNKQGVKFTTPALEKLNTPYNDLQEQYAEMQKQMTSGIIESSVGYIPSFKEMEKRIAVLDVLCGFSVMNATSVAAFVRPQLEEPGKEALE
ncbi:DNA mismatch repair protein Msh2 [Aphelenchoides fujianensis]|nr:DNA mismatch repair protein Msh2 [Aphelenchoides fujianensis]